MFNRLAIGLCLGLCACASAPPIASVKPQVRPITIVKGQSFDPKSALKEAQDFYQEENFLKSQELFLQILLRTPDDSEALLGYGNTNLALGQHYEAHNALQRLAESNIVQNALDDEKIGLILSTVLTGNTESPETLLNDALQIDYEDSRIWNALGQLLDQEGEWMRALDNYVKAMKLGGATASTINNMGMSLLLQGRYSESHDKFEQAANIDPKVKLYDNNRRLALIMLKDYKKAIERADDEFQSRLFNDAGYVAMQQGNHRVALEFFDQAIKISPSFNAKAEENLSHLTNLLNP